MLYASTKHKTSVDLTTLTNNYLCNNTELTNQVTIF